ncbi:hypothetical protein SFRURICE_017886 [Spodoptera frugiperda]|uniref:protein-disulfide reductase n=1 Tax=Spodoptera frugiperda TaxID=7108 RepID=A0A2H1W5B7_SPOFR|nr:hypothetical protein SFRURICE_017886 [Spodoptera frugiperda]
MSEKNYTAQQLNKHITIKTPFKHKRTKKWYGTEDPCKLPPFNWIESAKIYNHSYERVPIEWLLDSADILVLYFSMRNSDRSDNIMTQFYEVYENARYNNLPIEVINVPMDETREDMCISYADQANWFTLMFDDPIIITLQYRHEITAVPHLVVTRVDGSMVSSHGILDLDEFGKNALIAWLSTAAYTKPRKKLSRDTKMYGPQWKYLNAGVGKAESPDYKRNFSRADLSFSEDLDEDDVDTLVEKALKAEAEQDKEEDNL